jgi:hypothetical protein
VKRLSFLPLSSKILKENKKEKLKRSEKSSKNKKEKVKTARERK